MDLFDVAEVQVGRGRRKGGRPEFGFTVNGFYTKLKNIVSQGLVIDPVTGGSTWIIVTSPENKSYGAEIEAVAIPVRGLPVLGQAPRSSRPSSAPAPARTSAAGSPACRRRSPTCARRVYAPAPASSSRPTGTGSVRARWMRGRRLAPGLQLFQLRRGVCAPNTGTSINVDLLNAFQGKGLEEGNPRLGDHGRQPDLPGPAHSASAVQVSVVVRLRRRSQLSRRRSRRRACGGHPCSPWPAAC